MSLRKKTLLIIFVLLAGLISGLSYFLNYVLTKNFLELESSVTDKNIRRMREIYNSKLDALATKSADWGTWDDTYQFAQDRNEAYIESNLGGTTLLDLGVNFIIIADTSGGIVISTGTDIETVEPIRIPDELLAHVKLNDGITTHIHNDDLKTGFILTESYPLLFASRPIVKTDKSGPVAGTIIFARFLDEKLTSEMSLILEYPVNVLSPALNRDVYEKVESISAADRTRKVIDRSGNLIFGYYEIFDFYNKNSILLKYESPRTIYNEGERSIKYIISTLTAILLLTLVLIAFLLEMVILKPISNLTKEVQDVGRGQTNLNRILARKGKDEIAKLSKTAAQTFEKLSYTQEVLKSERERVKNYIDAAKVIFVAISPSETVLLINKTGCETLGLSEQEIVGKNWFETFFSKETSGKVRADYKRLVDGEEKTMEKYEAKILNGKGQERLVEWHNALIRNQKDEPVAIICSGEDVTEKRELDRKLNERTAELERTTKIMVGRELRMIELKKELEKLKGGGNNA